MATATQYPSEFGHDRPGTVIAGRYELAEVIGKGGMAVVWRGHTVGAAGFRRPVAVKRLLDGGTSEEQLALFVEEARVGAALLHPSIVQVFDFGVDESEEPYLVCELVDGPHLGDLAAAHHERGQPLSWPVIVGIAVETLRALEAAHERVTREGVAAPVLHRDVTPSNILVDRCGIVKLADFGLARAMDRERMTQPDIVKGKLSYLAPELLSGGAPSPRSDLFGLGVVLWEALTGERLFQASTDLSVVKLVHECRVPLLSKRRPDLPLGVVLAIHQALKADPESRFPSARAMLNALRQELRHVPWSGDDAAIASAVARFRDWPRKVRHAPPPRR